MTDRVRSPDRPIVVILRNALGGIVLRGTLVDATDTLAEHVAIDMSEPDRAGIVRRLKDLAP